MIAYFILNRIFSLVLLGFLAAQENVRGEDAALVLTNAAQVKALSVADAAKQIPVKLQGVVTGEGKLGIVIQDTTMGIFIFA